MIFVHLNYNESPLSIHNITTDRSFEVVELHLQHRIMGNHDLVPLFVEDILLLRLQPCPDSFSRLLRQDIPQSLLKTKVAVLGDVGRVFCVADIQKLSLSDRILNRLIFIDYLIYKFELMTDV